MLCAQLGNPQSYYGNIQLGRFIPNPYVWGAWKVRHHYQEPLTKAEELRIEEHLPQEPEINRDELIRELQTRVVKPHSLPEIKLGKKPVYKPDDDEAFFMFM